MSSQPKSFAVVISAHRPYDSLDLCLSGFGSVVNTPSDLIFVDNGSGGVLSSRVSREFPETTVIALERNQLFCGGYNAGMRAAIDRGYDYVLIVNADTEVVNRRFVETLIETMEQNPRAAFVGPLVYYRSTNSIQTTRQVFPSLVRNAVVWLPYRLFPQLVKRQPQKSQTVDFLNGVCVLCRVTALREIGLMDESFGAYVEDADWAWRARSLNWLSLFVPVPSIVHHEEALGYEHYSFKNLLLRTNTVRWFVKVGNLRAARAYATASQFLAWIRMLCAMDRRQRGLYRQYLHDLRRTNRTLLSTDADINDNPPTACALQVQVPPQRQPE